MLPTNAEMVWTILLAIIPGFIAVSVWARAKTWKGHPGNLRLLLQSIALSAVIQLVVAPLTIGWVLPVREDLGLYPERVVVWTVLVVLCLPILGGLLVSRISDAVFDVRSAAVTGRLASWLARVWPTAPPPSIWDWLLTGKRLLGRFLLIEYKDGTRTAGVFAQGSLGLTSPEPHGLFLASEWEVDEDGNITNELPDSAGVTILDTEQIRSIRLLRTNDES